MQPDNPSLSPLRKGGVKKFAKTCPRENGEKKFLHSNTIEWQENVSSKNTIFIKRKKGGVLNNYRKEILGGVWKYKVEN